MTLSLCRKTHLVEKIASEIGSKITKNTRNMMSQQKVPREKIAQGLDLQVYRRCGWVPPKDGSSEREELMIRKMDVELDSSASVLEVLDRLCDTYEEKHWKPENS